jgi:NAD(P)-dependent dehydrogenase (short-subunit alcohol dehydrogenase family)
MDYGIKGRTALVTGGSLGIGRSVALQLASQGVGVAITARNGARLAQVADELSQASGGRVVAVPADMSKKEDIERTVAATRAALGPIDILVNNAGSSPAGRIHELSDETWQKSFDLKLMGAVRSTRAVLPEMRQRRWGRIINIAGKGGEIYTPNYLLGAFNAAVMHFSRALAPDAARDNILVNCINPGATNTPRWHEIIVAKAKATGRSEQEVEAEWSATVPLGRVCEPDDVADLVTFLCSERARQIAGAVLNIDGGGAAGV